MQQGLTIVSNRLPVSVRKTDGELEFYPSIGGLATGLASYATNKRNKWIGWPGLASDHLSEAEKRTITQELRRHNCYPVFLTQKQLDDFYNGYSNSILWPLFHDVALAASARKQQDHYWQAYRRVNRAFADVVLALSNTGSRIWVHDYQLLLLPALLRIERPRDTIGFFLHIPFPSADRFAELPQAAALINGLLGADLVGFHTSSYVHNFLAACTRVGIGVPAENGILVGARVIQVSNFPMGIDYTKFVNASQDLAVRRELAKFRTAYRGYKVILTVDRLDPTKGLVERAAAYKEFLIRNPRLRGKVILVMLAVPSRTDIAEYKKLKNRLEELVDNINATFRTKNWEPVQYLYQSMPFEQLAALYQRADVAFIAPLRDGMNLVAKEYLASKPKQNGVLILSKTAGAAEELTDALVVDPARPSTLVKALTRALTMPRAELKARIDSMQQQLSTATVQQWAGNFMQSLSKSRSLPVVYTKTLTPARTRELMAAFRQARKRVLMLDYDGVLVPFANRPDLARPPQQLLTNLRKLAALDHTSVVIISGRSKADLMAWFGDLPVTLIAEHGAFTRSLGAEKWRSTGINHTAWKQEVLPILERYTAKTPGAILETKDASLVWHYRQAKPYYAQKYLVIIKRLLKSPARTHNLDLQQGNMILEVRPRGINKGIAARSQVKGADFILAIGDDTTDEDMFEWLPESAWTVKVGRGHTSAHYRSPNIAAIHELLKKLTR